MNNPLIIGISGGSGSGKTLFINKLKDSFIEGEVTILSLDNYYKPINKQPVDENGIENFDLPESLDENAFYEDLMKLKEGDSITIHTYTFNNQNANPEQLNLKPAKILVVEGIFAFYFEKVNHLLDLRIFIEAPDYLMLSRRIIRDGNERGYDIEDVRYRFKNHVIPAYNQFIGPLKSKSDLIIPNHTHFAKALEVVVNYIKFHLIEKL